MAKKLSAKKAKKAVKKKKQKLVPTDGLGPKEIKSIRIAVRQVWHRSHARKLCVNRSIGKDGFHRCELCKKKVPKVKIDHKQKVGDVDNGFIKRMFCPSKDLQALCDQCHNQKTKDEKKLAKITKEVNERSKKRKVGMEPLLAAPYRNKAISEKELREMERSRMIVIDEASELPKEFYDKFPGELLPTPRCRVEPLQNTEACERCSGKGFLMLLYPNGSISKKCEDCDGTGKEISFL